jgi:hypothetical protein
MYLIIYLIIGLIIALLILLVDKFGERNFYNLSKEEKNKELFFRFIMCCIIMLIWPLVLIIKLADYFFFDGKKRKKENDLIWKMKKEMEDKSPKPDKAFRAEFMANRTYGALKQKGAAENNPDKKPHTIAETKNGLLSHKEQNIICFADTTHNPEFEEYFTRELGEIKALFSDSGWNFTYIIDTGIHAEVFGLMYYLPFISSTVFIDAVKNHNPSSGHILGNEILKWCGYDDSNMTGFISVQGDKFIFIGKKEDESIEAFVKGYASVIPPQRSLRNFGAMPRGHDSELDNEAQSVLNNITAQLDRLKESGQFFLIAPALLEMIEKTAKETPTVSRMLISKDFRIFLPDYQNREIRLSHLTKSIYFLFLKHPEGIDTQNFNAYTNELFEIYKKVSYRLDVDKMRESVSELSDMHKLRVHLSRIKSAFIKEFSDYYAGKYYISGEGAVRNILLDRQLLTWEEEI